MGELEEKLLHLQKRIFVGVYKHTSMLRSIPLKPSLESAVEQIKVNFDGLQHLDSCSCVAARGHNSAYLHFNYRICWHAQLVKDPMKVVLTQADDRYYRKTVPKKPHSECDHWDVSALDIVCP